MSVLGPLYLRPAAVLGLKVDLQRSADETQDALDRAELEATRAVLGEVRTLLAAAQGRAGELASILRIGQTPLCARLAEQIGTGIQRAAALVESVR